MLQITGFFLDNDVNIDQQNVLCNENTAPYK